MIPDWLYDIYALCEAGSTDTAIDVLFKNIDSMSRNGEFEECDRLLLEIDLDKLNTSLMVALLSITLAAKNQLPQRVQVIAAIKSRLQETDPDRVENLLKRLY